MYKSLCSGRDYYLFKESIIDNVESSFNCKYWQQQNAIIGSAQGRGTTWFIQLETMQAALRHYRRGGLFAKLVTDAYFFTGFENTRSVQEFKLLHWLREKGVNVPLPIAARAVRKGLFYQADILTEKIANAKDLVDLLVAGPLDKSLYQAIGREIKKLHQAQVNHTDLNIHNILIDKDAKVWIIDFDKCYQQSGDSWKAANLERLLRSFNKELNKRNIHWQKADWQILTKAYHAQ